MSAGEEAFDGYFSEVYGSRWKALKDSLLKNEIKVESKPIGIITFTESKILDLKSYW